MQDGVILSYDRPNKLMIIPDSFLHQILHTQSGRILDYCWVELSHTICENISTKNDKSDHCLLKCNQTNCRHESGHRSEKIEKKDLPAISKNLLIFYVYFFTNLYYSADSFET